MPVQTKRKPIAEMTPRERELEEQRIRRNARRRERYAKDSEVRDYYQRKYRKKYQEENESHSFDKGNCASRIDKLDKYGKVRFVIHPKTDRRIERLSFSVDELAVVLGDYNPLSIRNWITDGKMPGPKYQGIDEQRHNRKGKRRKDGSQMAYSTTVRKKVKVYTAEEVRAILDVMMVHQLKTRLIREDTHAETICELHNRVNHARTQIDWGGTAR